MFVQMLFSPFWSHRFKISLLGIEKPLLNNFYIIAQFIYFFPSTHRLLKGKGILRKCQFCSLIIGKHHLNYCINYRPYFWGNHRCEP